MAEKHSGELTAEDYFRSIKDSIAIQAKVETKFIREEDNQDKTITVSDLLQKKKTVVYWKSNKNSQYKVIQNVTLVKVLIEDCSNCTFSFLGPITTSVVEVWRCNNVTIIFDTEILTLQCDLSTNLTIQYKHKKHLGSIVQAGIKGLRINFEDYNELGFDSGYEILKEQHKDLNINDTTDQFITRFVEGKLLTELVLRDEKGMHTTEREKDEFEELKAKNDQATEEQVRKMLKLAGPAIGLSEDSINAKSKEGKAEKEEKEKLEAKSNIKKNAGNKAFTQGDYHTAISRYTEAIELTPENHLIYSNRCSAYYYLKQYDKALEDADKCIELNPHFPKGHLRKGMVLMELKQKDEAIKSLTSAHDLAPKDEEILSSLTKAKAM